jgi:hypothetical protein
MKTTSNSDKSAVPAAHEIWLETVRSQVASLRFGVVQIVVHDSQVVQLERTEKLRLDYSPTVSSHRPINILERQPNNS